MINEFFRFFIKLYDWFSGLDNSDKITFFIFFLGVVASIVGFVFKELLSDKAYARRFLHRKAKDAKKDFFAEGIFFQEGNKPKWKFSKAIPSIDISSMKKPFVLRGSFLVIGEAGCGKSAFLQENFIRTFRLQCWIRLIFPGKRICWLDAHALKKLLLQEDTQKTFIEQLEKAKLSKLYLYVDGLDEISDSYMESFFCFLDAIKNRISVTLRISCRTEFYKKHLKNEQFDFRIKIEKWTPAQLLQLADLILNSLKHFDTTHIQKVKTYLKSDSVPWDFIQSPLLLKLLLYVRLYSRHITKETDNMFKFYSDFIDTVLDLYKIRHYEAPVDSSSIDKVSADVFVSYSNGEKTIPYTPILRPLIKYPSDSSQHRVCLVHETFYEYFTARHYRNQFIEKRLDSGAVEVLKVHYNNDYADFITYAFTDEPPEKQTDIIHNMANLYSYTLSPKNVSTFKKLFNINDLNNTKLKSLLKKTADASCKTSNPFLTKKYEIIFSFCLL